MKPTAPTASDLWRNECARLANQLHKKETAHEKTHEKSYKVFAYEKDGTPTCWRDLTLEEAFEVIRLDTVTHPTRHYSISHTANDA